MIVFPLSISNLLICWVIFLSIIALAMMGVDKARAKARGSRIRENTFGAISILGGFPGVILGGLVFHHKTSKVKFWMPVVVALLLWDVLFLIAFNIVKL